MNGYEEQPNQKSVDLTSIFNSEKVRLFLPRIIIEIILLLFVELFMDNSIHTFHSNNKIII